jgi:hypothetical protein
MPDFYACHPSVSLISAPKRLAIVLNCSMLIKTYFFGAEIRVAEIRQASKISPYKCVYMCMCVYISI